MKLYKKLLSLLCVLAMLAAAIPAASAYSSSGSETDADILYTLGLIQSSGSGYQLTRQPTRAEALTLAVRLSGNESQALSGNYSQPFTDVPDWADKYVAYAYASGIIDGSDKDSFAPSRAASESDFVTMLLRVMGYSDTNGDFTWSDSVAFADRLGIIDADSDGEFTRADMFAMALSALTRDIKGSSQTLLEKLIADGVIDAAKANAVGLAVGRELNGEEIFSQCTDAVFQLYLFDTEANFESGVSTANASGFFISSDGIAVSNFHPFPGSSIAVVRLNNGEYYKLEKILYFDYTADLTVFKVSNTSISGKTTSAFPYLEMLKSSEVKTGETVYAIGNPLLLTHTISSGIVSGIDRAIEGFSQPMIQNTAAISSGSSGGVLLNAYGKAIGITSGYFIYGQSLNLAVPLDEVFTVDTSAAGCSITEMLAQVPADTDTEESAG